ncbi:MAG TPA: PASTA domain-containing protein [Terriglobia bacterium]|nr:PASTA domain-containing protein [Terriglobia bacterium]
MSNDTEGQGQAAQPAEEPQIPRESALSRFSGIALMVMILVVAGILSALTAMRFAIRGREVVTPSLIGKTPEDAQRRLAEEGLLIKVAPSKRFSPDVPEGHIMDQNPPEGTRVKTGRSIKVLISNGDRKYEVPDLVGSSLRTAQLALSQRHLTLGNVTSAYMSGEGPTVVDQYPPSGRLEGSEPTVDVLISLGQPTEDFIMPNLIGQRADQVLFAARREGFHVGPLNRRKSPGVEPGMVIQQTPQAGYRISQTQTIMLDVSQ